MAEVGTYYITIMPDMSKFTGGVNKALSGAGATGGKQYSRSFSDVLKGSALGTALGNLAASAGRSIVGGLQTGIGRLDTIKNFPKVMTALGFSASDASDSIALIMKRLDGLPTATQDVVTLTQAIADSTGDLDLATKAALGFNDMMLANGASAGEVTQAQGVLNRVLGKGNATVAQWQSLQSVMPAQMAAVAREILGEGGSVEELRDKLNDGTVSWDEFLQAIVRLDTEGSGAVASFRDQAVANSVGIGTALTNVQNRIGAGWAAILDAFGQENISGAIDAASYGVKDAMERIADGIGYVRDLVADTSIGESLKRIGDAVGQFTSALWTDADTQRAKDFAAALVDLIDNALQWLADHGDVVTTAVGAMAGALAGLVGVQIGTWLAGLPAAFTALSAALAANPLFAIGAAIGAVGLALYTFFTTTKTGQRIVTGVIDGVKGLLNGLVRDFRKGMARIKQNLEDNKVQWEKFKSNVKGAVDNAKKAVKGAVDGIVKLFRNLKNGISNTVNGIKTAITNGFNTAKTNATNAVNNLKTGVTNAWNNLKTSVSNTINGIKTAVTNGWNGIKTSVTNVVNGLKTSVVNGWNGIKTSVGSVVNGIKTSVTSTWNGIKSSVSGVVNGIRSSVTGAFNSLKSSVASVWNGIKTAITSPINSAKNTLSGIVNKIKGFFPLRIGKIFSGLKLPHISVSGGRAPFGIGGKGSLPHFSVSWYAKGGVFDSPTIIGVGEGSSSEAVLPLNGSVFRRIARGIVAEGGGGGVTITGNTFYVREEADIDRIADRLARKIRREGVSLA